MGGGVGAESGSSMPREVAIICIYGKKINNRGTRRKKTARNTRAQLFAFVTVALFP